MKFRVLLITTFLFLSKAYSQQFYANTNTGAIYGITINGSNYTSQLIPSCFANAYSIAMAGKTLYYVDGGGSIIKADLINGAAINCTRIGLAYSGSSSFTINSKGILYFATGNLLYKYDPNNPGIVALGTMPFYSGGDLVFYKNNLYMATDAGIVLVNQTNPALSTSLLLVPYATYGQVYGLVTAVVNDKIKVYAFGAAGAKTNLIELDLDNKVIKGIVSVLPYTVYDGASPSETGSINQIKVTSINITQQCSQFNRADVKIICQADTNQYTYKLGNSPANQTGNFSNLAPGNYDLSIVSTSGDTKDTTVTIPDYKPAIHPVNINFTNPDCITSGSIQFNTTQTDPYTINYNGNIYPPTAAFTGLSQGQYHFTIYNQNGCVVDTLYANLITKPCPKITIDSIKVQKDCNSVDIANIQIYASPHTSVLTYSLNNISNLTGTFNNLIPGTYNLKITSPTAIEKDTAITVKNFLPLIHPVKATGTMPACQPTGNISFSTTETNIYTVKYGGNFYPLTNIFNGLQKGIYHFDVYNQAGCIIDTLIVNLVPEPCPQITIDSISIKKECSSIKLGNVHIFAQPKTLALTYSLNTITNTTGNFSNLSAGSYIIKITSPVAIEKDTTIIVSDFSPLNHPVKITATNPKCITLGNIQFNTTETNIYTLKYNNIAYPLNHNFTGLTQGAYHFEVYSQNGCLVDTLYANLITIPCPNITIDSISIKKECSSLKLGNVKIFVQPQTVLLTYHLNSITNTTGVFSNLTAGAYNVKITSPVAIEKDTMIIVPDFSPVSHPIKISITNPDCITPGSVQFSSSPINTYTIKYNNTFYPLSHNFTGLAQGAHHFEAYDQNGCLVDTLYANLITTPCPQIIIDSLSIKKECNSVQLGKIQIYASPKSAGLTYNLNNSYSNSTGMFGNMPPGTYSLKITSPAAIEKDTSITVPDYYLNKPSTIYATKLPTCDIPGQIQFTISGKTGAVYKIGYQGNIYNQTSKITGLFAGKHFFSILTNDGCLLDTITVSLNRIGQCEILVFPNTFTPNNDGVNDLFRPIQDKIVKNYDLKIYNRNGMLVFSSKNFSIGWDGNYLNKQANVGTYYWIVTFINDIGKVQNQSGSATLIR